jgi:hypothetical protein
VIVGTFNQLSIEISREGDIWTINMRNPQHKIIKDFTEFRLGMEKQSLKYSFLVTYESGKLIAVETWHTNWGQSIRQVRWVWEITGDELTQTNTQIGKLNAEVVHFKRV